MLSQTRLVTLAVAATGIGLAACSSTIHDSERGAYVYERPWMKSIEPASLDQVYQASQQALNDLDLRIQNRREGAMDARVTAEEADGTNVRVDLEKVGDNSTRLAIKVGTFGDQEVARMVLDKIRNNLGGATAQRPAEPEARTTPAGFREDGDQTGDQTDDEEWLQENQQDMQDDMQQQSPDRDQDTRNQPPSNN